MADNRVPGGRTYGAQPSLDPKADPNSDEFVNPFLSSNAALGLPEAGPSNRPDGWTDEDEEVARAAGAADIAEPDPNYHG